MFAATLLTLIFTVSTLAQVSYVGAENGETPVTPPLTSPVTSPEPSPSITPLVTVTPSLTPTPTDTPPDEDFEHSISGNVTYRFLSWFWWHRKKSEPAEDVTIKARNFFTHELFTTQTDEDGNYMMFVPEGLYLVKAQDEQDSLLIPFLRGVHINRDRENVDFKGLVFH